MIKKVSRSIYMMGLEYSTSLEKEYFYNIIPVDEYQSFFYFGTCHNFAPEDMIKIRSYLTGALDNIAGFVSSLSLIANNLNAQLRENTSEESYVSIFLGFIDEARSRIRYLNCGHEFPFIIKKGVIQELTSGEVILGIFENLIFCEEEFEFSREDKIFLFNKNVFLLNNGQFSLTRNKLKNISDNLKHFYKKKFLDTFSNEIKDYCIPKVENKNFIFLLLGYNDHADGEEHVIQFNITADEIFRQPVLEALKSIASSRKFSESLAEEITDSFYKVFDNCVKYAYKNNREDRKVDVLIKYTNYKIEISVKDFGIGFVETDIFRDIRERSSSLARVETCMDIFSIKSKPQNGAEIIFGKLLKEDHE